MKALLILNLVYNPTGAFLPLERRLKPTFAAELKARYGYFNNLYNHEYAGRTLPRLSAPFGKRGKYMRKLVGAFNPATVEDLMCRNLISVD